jgi:hypothetical protein
MPADAQTLATQIMNMLAAMRGQVNTQTGQPFDDPTIQRAVWNRFGEDALKVFSEGDDLTSGPFSGIFNSIAEYGRTQGFLDPDFNIGSPIPKDLGMFRNITTGTAFADRTPGTPGQAPPYSPAAQAPGGPPGPQLGGPGGGQAPQQPAGNVPGNIPQDPAAMFGPLAQQFMQGQIPQLPGYFQPAPGLTNQLTNFLTSPATLPANLGNFMGGLAGRGAASPLQNQLSQALLGGDPRLQNAAQQILGGPSVFPGVQAQIQNLQRQGFPGQAQLADEQAMAQLLGGSQQLAGQLVPQLLSTTQAGLPGQMDVQGLVPSQLQLGQAAQQRAFQGLGPGPLTTDIQQRAGQMLTTPLQAQAPQIQVPQAPAPPSVSAPAITTPGSLQSLAQQFPTAPQVTPPPFMQPAPVGAPSIQETVQSALQQQIQGGGLTPGFVSAQERLVLDPARERLLAQLNQRQLGAASLGGGLAIDQIRELEQNFADRLLSTGFQNFQGALAQGAGFGQQQFGQGLANQAALQQARQFGAGQGLQADVYNQQAALEAARLGQAGLGQAAGLETQLALARPQFDIQSQLANQAALQRFGEYNPQIALQAALANQAAAQRGGEFNIDALVRQAQMGGGLQGQLFGQQAETSQQLAALGGQGLTTGLQAFGAVPSSVIPALSLQAQVQQGLANQALQRFGTLGTQNLNFLRTAGELGQVPFDVGLRQQQQDLARTQVGAGREQFLGTMLQQNIANALAGQRQAQQFGLGQTNIAGNILSSLLSGVTQRQIAQEQAGAQRTTSLLGLGGALAPALIKEIPGWLGGDDEIEIPPSQFPAPPNIPLPAPPLPKGMEIPLPNPYPRYPSIGTPVGLGERPMAGGLGGPVFEDPYGTWGGGQAMTPLGGNPINTLGLSMGGLNMPQPSMPGLATYQSPGWGGQATTPQWELGGLEEGEVERYGA